MILIHNFLLLGVFDESNLFIMKHNVSLVRFKMQRNQGAIILTSDISNLKF